MESHITAKELICYDDGKTDYQVQWDLSPKYKGSVDFQEINNGPIFGIINMFFGK